MNGAGRPCENPTINTAILLSDYALAQGMCLYLLRSGFSVGLRRGALRATRLFCDARFLARFARYAAFCIARLRGFFVTLAS